MTSLSEQLKIGYFYNQISNAAVCPNASYRYIFILIVQINNRELQDYYLRCEPSQKGALLVLLHVHSQ